MLKKFVALHDDVEPFQTPYTIKTYNASGDKKKTLPKKPCIVEKQKCPLPKKKLSVKPITIEEAIFHWFETPRKPMSQLTCKEKCDKFDKYTCCVVDQRSPKVLKEHAVLREKYLKLKSEPKKVVHSGEKEPSDGASLIEMGSVLIKDGNVRLRNASPVCSMETFYVPSRRLLDLKRPRSGIFINETTPVNNSDIPYETYNPRQLQEKIENEKRQKYHLFVDGDEYFFPWIRGQNLSATQSENKNQINNLNQDQCCFKPVIFPIPKDLERTFKASVVFGNSSIIPNDMDIKCSRPVEIACLYTAYIQSFTKSLDYWSADTIDDVIQCGKDLHQKSQRSQYQSQSTDFDIIPEIAEQNAAIDLKFHLTASLMEEPNVLKALTLFFDNFHAGILCADNLYLLIWKRCMETFYIFDPNGRDEQCKREYNNGNASLLVISTIEHIVHLVLNYSRVKTKSDYNLYEIKLTDFGKLTNPIRLKTLKPPEKLYAIVNPFYAIIPAASGLSVSPEGKSFVPNASLMTCYLTLVYSQIDPQKEFSVHVVDDLIKFGVKYYSDFMSDNRIQVLNIADLPQVLLFGNYRVLVDKHAFVKAGHVVDCRSYRCSQLTQAMKDFLLKYSYGLIEIDNSTLAVWKQENTLFVFDPFKRGPAGQAEVVTKSSTGCLQIHLSLTSMCRMLYRNSIHIRKEGNFFIHGIRVRAVGTFNLNRAFQDSVGFGTLQIKYPFDCSATFPSEKEEEQEDTPILEPLTFSIAQCLSELSVSPCERTCSERDFLIKQKKLATQTKRLQSYSIVSIPDEYRIPEYDNVDVIDGVVVEFIDNLIEKIRRRTEKKPKPCNVASKILLKSDKKHLEDLKLKLKRGEDYDNICSAFQLKEPATQQITLKEELAQETNFKSLPDGSWGIFGQINELYVTSGSLKGILSTIIAAVLSSKYNITTWNTEVIDHALSSSEILEDRFWTYSHTLDLIFRNQIPKIQAGTTSFEIKVLSTKTVESEKLKTELESFLSSFKKLIIICKGLTFLVLRKNNFIYMFVGYSCDVVGFRSQSNGPLSLLRFIETDGLIRRIDQACGPCQKYVFVEITVKNLEEKRYAMRTKSEDDMYYSHELDEKEKQKQRYNEKMKFLESEIEKETKRVKDFKKEKSRAQFATDLKTSYILSDSIDDVEDEFYEDSEKSIEFKHKPRGDSSMEIIQEHLDQRLQPKPLYGYLLREADCLFKIQGSTSLSNRFVTIKNQVRPCFFASTVAILYGILRPLNHWGPYRVDKVITVAKDITNNGTKNFDASVERIINNIDADEFVFEVKVFTYIPPGTFGGNIGFVLEKALKIQHYVLLQIPNTTFAIYRDQYYHLFDPYPSMEVTIEETVERPRCPKHLMKHEEHNTASWILFGDINSLFEYISKRTEVQDWQSQYNVHALNILNYKSAPKRKQLINMLTDELDSCQVDKDTKADFCTQAEEMEWLDIYPNLVFWSRLNRTNTANRVRGSPLTKEKNFDIEIPGKLYSLWGSIHPLSSVFGEYRGKQHLAINVVACCMTTLYNVKEWNTQIIDYIVITGHEYYKESIGSIKRKNYEISLEHLNTGIQMGHLYFRVHLESVLYGVLYTKAKHELNLAAALGYFFNQHTYGILQCMKHSIAIGKIDSGFFMFECQSHGMPLFPHGEGAAYILRTNELQVLLHCIVMTLNNTFYNSQFTIHTVTIIDDYPEGPEVPEIVDEED